MPIPMASFYRYDQMNRLKKVQSYDHSTTSSGLAWDTYAQDDRFQMELEYDLNGNILSLSRNGNLPANLEMDRFNYKYYSLNNAPSQQDIQLAGFNGDNTSIATNRLSLLEENISLALPSNYSSDIDGQSGTGNVTYQYDALGNLTQDLSEDIQEIKWNAYGKVIEVLRTNTCPDKPDLVFIYDAFGQRIKKIVKKRTAGVLSNEKDWKETYYVRDAQGNVMAMYNHTSTFFPNNNNYVSESFSISEWNLYGSSRLGTRNLDKPTDVIFLASRNYNWINSTVTNEYIAPTQSFTYKKYRVLGTKTFELTNHLGNVISTVSDRKLMVQNQQTPGFVHHYKPEILSIGEQYAFGMSMPGRIFSVENYRYGFNGKENQDELLGDDNAQDFGARMYDARVGRWWGIDPSQKKFGGFSPYNFNLNSPFIFIDKDGLEPTKAGKVGLYDLVNVLNQKSISSYTEFFNAFGGHLGTSLLGENNGEFDKDRYIYSAKWGWVDMRHFSWGAWRASMIIQSAEGVLEDLEDHERSNEDPESTFDYEDLVSNLLGVYFVKYMQENAHDNKTFTDNLKSYLEQLGFVNNPEVLAPNYDKLLSKSKYPGKHPENRTYNPLYKYPNAEKMYNPLDRKILNFKAAYLKGKDTDRKYVTTKPKKAVKTENKKGTTPKTKKNDPPTRHGNPRTL
jgi:RHS repeat-associated protein